MATSDLAPTPAPTPHPPAELMTLRECELDTGGRITVWTIRAWIKSGKLPSRRLGRHRYVLRHVWRAYIYGEGS